jgi:hypothetical protein
LTRAAIEKPTFQLPQRGYNALQTGLTIIVLCHHGDVAAQHALARLLDLRVRADG